MNSYKYIFSIAVFLLVLTSADSLLATHVAGGNLTYRCLGNSRYEVTLDFRRDCFNGATDAQFDDPAAIGIFDQNGFLVEILGQGGMMFIPFSDDDTLNEVITSQCNVIGGDVCTQTTTYRDTVILPYRAGGYFLAYQRCCRNATLNNIVDPLNTGATYWIRITEKALLECNSSPDFNEWPISFICIDDTLRFDHSATDIDGDSLVYEFCTPSTGATRQFPKPVPPASPPYGSVEYHAGFTSKRPFGQNVLTSINAQTGMLTVVPDKVGQYLVGICVREFRDGQLLSEVRRDFEYNVRVCGRAPVAMFETVPAGIDTQCDGLDVAFSNSTTSNFLPPDSLDYTWYFDWPFNTLVSNEMNPMVSYPQPGAYTVAMIASDGTCQDTFYYDLGVSTPDDPDPGFSLEASNCEGTVEIYLNDETVTVQDVIERQWVVEGLGFSDTLYGLTPRLEVGTDQVVTITLTVSTESGCDGMITEMINISTQLFESTYEDQIICDNDETLLFTNRNIGATVSVVPDDNITVVGNDYFLSGFSGEQDFIVTIQDSFCIDVDTINIMTFPQPDRILEDIVQCGADTVALNPGGRVDYHYIWSSSGMLPFDPHEANPVFSLDSTQAFFVEIYTSEGSDCFTRDTATVTVSPYPEFDFFPSANIITCQDSSLQISVNTTDSVRWTNVNGVQVGSGPEIFINRVNQNSVLTAIVTNDLGCVTEKDVRINISSEPDFSFTPDSDMIVCMGDSAVLEIISSDSIVWENEMGDVIQIGNSITLDSVTELQQLTVTAYNQFGCPGSQTVLVEVYQDPAFSLADSSQLDVCFGEATTVELITQDSVVWTDVDGNILGTGRTLTVEDIQANPVLAITVINTDGCSITDTIEFNTLPLPMPDAGPLDNIVVCRGFDYTIELPAMDSVTWLTMDGDILETGNMLLLENNTADTTYQVLFITDLGCEARDTFDVTIQSDIMLEIDQDDEIFYCTADTIPLSISADAVVDIEWFENNILIGTGPGIDFMPSGNTEVLVVATDSLGCTDRDSIVFTESLVDGTLIVPSDMCLGDIISLQFIAQNPEAVEDIIWEPDSLITGDGFNVTASPTMNTTFSVTVIDTVGCSNSFSGSVLVGGFDASIEVTADPEEILLSESSQLEAEFDGSWEYAWSPAESLDDPFISDPIATPNETTTYVVTVTDEFGCTGTGEVTVRVIQPNCDESDIFVPNLFTPNNDFVNDEFRVESNFIESMRLVIYNRWGEEVFVAESQDETWDGTFEGKPLEPDVFGFHLQAICINGFDYQTQGNITLMK